MTKDYLPYVFNVVLCFFVAIWVAWKWHLSIIQYLTLTFGIKRCKLFFKAFLLPKELRHSLRTSAWEATCRYTKEPISVICLSVLLIFFFSSFIHSFFHSLTHSFTHSFIHPSVCPPVRMCVRSFLRWFVCLPLFFLSFSSFSLIPCLCVSLTHSLIHPCIHPSIRRSFVDSSVLQFFFFLSFSPFSFFLIPCVCVFFSRFHLFFLSFPSCFFFIFQKEESRRCMLA